MGNSREVLVAAACIALQGCAMEVVRVPAPLAGGTVSEQLVLAAPIELHFESGATRALPAGTRLMVTGTIPQGRVLKPGSAFTIAGRHTHEAYLVERQGLLVGFYLPAEKAFSAYPDPLNLPLERSDRP